MGRYFDLNDVVYDHPLAIEELAEYREMEKKLEGMAKLLKCKPLEVAEKVRLLLENIKRLEREKERLTKLLNE